MDKAQLDNRIEAFMARKMKQFPDIDKRYRAKSRVISKKKTSRQPQIWILNPSLY